MTIIGDDTSHVAQADPPATVQPRDPVGRVHLGRGDKLRLLRERWSEFISLLTPDFWLKFAIIFLHLTALTMMVMLIRLSGK